MKYNFTDVFERTDYDGKYDEVDKFANGTIKRNRDGTPILRQVRRVNGRL